MKLIEFHVFDSKETFSVNPDAIEIVSSIDGHGYVGRTSGAGTETFETYETIIAWLTGKEV